MRTNLTKYALWLGPGGPTDKENQVKMYKTGTVLSTVHYLFETVRSGSVLKWKAVFGSMSKWSGSARLHPTSWILFCHTDSSMYSIANLVSSFRWTPSRRSALQRMSQITDWWSKCSAVYRNSRQRCSVADISPPVMLKVKPGPAFPEPWFSAATVNKTVLLFIFLKNIKYGRYRGCMFFPNLLYLGPSSKPSPPPPPPKMTGFLFKKSLNSITLLKVPLIKCRGLFTWSKDPPPPGNGMFLPFVVR